MLIIFGNKLDFLIIAITTTAAYLNIILCQQEKLSTNLSMRDLTFEKYVQKLAEQRTNGYDLVLKILAEMFCVSIIILFENYLWKSKEKSLDEFHLYFMLFAQGRFMSASRIDKKKLIVKIPKCLSSSVKGLRSASMNGDITDEPINLSRAKCTVDAPPMPPPTTIDMSVAESSKSTLGKYFQSNIMFSRNGHKTTIYGTPRYTFFLYNFADRFDIQVGMMISSTVNDLNPRRVDEFLLAFGRTCFKVSSKF